MADLKVTVDYTELTGLIKTSDQTKRSLSLMAQSFAKTGDQSAYMAGINKIFAAQENLNESSRMTRSEIMKLGHQMKQEVKFAEALAAATGRLDAATKKASLGVGRMGKNTNLTGKNVNRLGMQMQQAGYQVGDFAVQVQGGQNVMVALGQQGAQLLGIFGPAGAIAGAGLAIGTALVAPLMRGEKAAGGLTDKIKQLKEELSNLRGEEILPEEAVTLLAEQEVLHLKILKTNDDLAKAKKLQKDFNREGAKASLVAQEATANVFSLETSLSQLLEKRKDNSKVILEYQTALSDKKRELFLDEQADLSRQVSMLTMIKMFGEDSLAVKNLEKQHALEIYEAELKRSKFAPQQIAALVEQRAVALGLKNEIDGAADKGRDLAAALKEAASAMASLSGFGAGLDKALAVSVAKVNALKSGADSAIAGTIAGMSIDLAAKSQAALSKGADPIMVAAESAIGKATISQLETSEVERKRLEAANRASSSGVGGVGGSKESPQEKLAEYIANKEKELELETKLVGIFGAERDIQSELFKARDEYSGVITEDQATELEGTLRLIEAEKQRQEALEEAKEQQQSIADTLQSSMSDAFMSMVDGTKSFKDAMKDMARAVIKQLFDILVVQKLVGSFDAKSGVGSGIVGSIMGLFGSANGNVFSGGSHVQAYANGGVVGGPTMFPMTGGKTGLMGEAGPEAIMPLKRGSNGKLGVQMEGGAGGDTVVNNYFNVSANGDDSVKRIIRGEIPRITEATKAAVVDAKRRGGSYGRSF